VHGESIRTDEYQRRVLYERLRLDTFLQNLQTQLAQLDPQDPTGGFLAQYYQQIGQQVQQQRLGVDQQTVDDMVEEKLVRGKAAELGITLSEDELNEAVRVRIASLSGYLTETQATAIASTVVAATATAETFTPTPEPAATATLTVTQVTTATPPATLEIPTPAPTPTRHLITQEEFSQGYADYLNSLKEETGLSEAEYRQTVEAELLTNKVHEYFADQVPKEAEQVNASHIQTDTEEEAKAALERLDGGEDFALVASEVSTDTFTAESGGELGWFLKEELEGRYGTPAAEAVFLLQPGEYSQPISSLDGWHIFKVNERQVRPLEDYQLQTRQQQAYTDWLQEARSAEGIEVLWEPSMAPPDPLLETPANPPLGSLPTGNTQE
jgi:parvulin-like peptidyl-prolyl isomerase